MITALQRLQGAQQAKMPDELTAFGINTGSMMGLFASHPPLEARIQALQNTR